MRDWTPLLDSYTSRRFAKQDSSATSIFHLLAFFYRKNTWVKYMNSMNNPSWSIRHMNNITHFFGIEYSDISNHEGMFFQSFRFDHASSKQHRFLCCRLSTLDQLASKPNIMFSSNRAAAESPSRRFACPTCFKLGDRRR